jgi:hypothetical protein
MKRIIYPRDNGGVCVVIPSGELPFEEVCRKDVPAGIPYLVVNQEDYPSPADKVFFDAWEADFSNPDGYGIGADAWFAAKAAAEAAEQTEEAPE